MKSYTIAIIGAGLIGKKRADALKKIPNTSLAGIYDISDTISKTFAKNYQCNIYKSIDEIIHDPTINFVILAIRHKDAAEIAPLVLQFKPLLMEKPMGRFTGETKLIIASARKHKNNVFVGFNYEYYPHIKLAKQYIKEKKLGNIISSTFILGHAAEPGYESSWKMDKDLCGGGVIIDPGIHMIDLMLQLFGKPSQQLGISSKLGWNTNVEDEAFITFTFPDGSISQHHYSLNMAKNTCFIEFIGTAGVLRLQGRGGRYGSMQFELVPRWHWQANEKIIHNDFGQCDDSFYEELLAILHEGKKTISEQETRYKRYENGMDIITSLYGG